MIFCESKVLMKKILGSKIIEMDLETSSIYCGLVTSQLYFRTHLESVITDQDSRSVFSVDISKGGRTRTLTLSDAYLCWHGDGCRWMRVLCTWKPKYFRQSSPHDSRCQWVKLGATLRVDFCRCRQERGVGWESQGVLRFFFSPLFLVELVRWSHWCTQVTGMELSLELERKLDILNEEMRGQSL